MWWQAGPNTLTTPSLSISTTHSSQCKANRLYNRLPYKNTTRVQNRNRNNNKHIRLNNSTPTLTNTNH